MSDPHRLDLVVQAGQVLSMLDQDAPITAIGVRDGLIVVTGDSGQAADWTTSRTLNLGDAVIMPGLTDAHTHPIMGTDMTAGVNLTSAASIDDVRELLALAASSTTPGGWLLAWGLDFNVFTDGPPRGDLFDEFIRGLPLFIRMFDGHSGIVNPTAISRCGITGRERFDQAASIDVDRDGRPTGLLREFGAMELVQHHLPVSSEEEFATRLLENLTAMSATGLTGGHAMDFIGEPVSMLEKAEAMADLPLRLRFSPWCSPGLSDADLEHLLALQQLGGRRWAVEGVKLFIDGTIDNGTAWLQHPDSHGESAASFWPNPADYARAVRWLDGHGVPTATHTTGDGGLLFALDSLAGLVGAQHRIEHIETAAPVLVARFADQAVAASMQPTHGTHYTRADEKDNWSVRLGPERIAEGWPTRSLRDSGAVLALGSDWPIAPFDPRAIMGDAQLRRRSGSPQDEPIQPGQALTALMALEGYTSHCAAAAGHRGRAGVIAVGAIADFTVMGENPLGVDPDCLAEVPIVATMVGGSVQYRGASYQGAL
jgi:predicted amidohydrolase YtcJ